LRRLFNNEEVAVPNAGAGSYDDVFKLFGFDKIEVYDWTSSAGDWTFMLHQKGGWRWGFQTNRYPYYGFTYGIGDFLFKTKKALMQHINN
jgi:hypothetical protein